MRPSLVVFRDGREIARVDCPEDLGARDWILGVVALQVDDEGARVRAHRTGLAAPTIVPLADDALVQVSFGEAALPRLAPAAAPGLTVYRDGEPLASTPFAAGRAFGHVFCRYLRSGEEEAGFDLTPFLDLPEGVKYQRLLSEPLRSGECVSYALVSPALRGRRPSRPGR
jgi:hypothetical protein